MKQRSIITILALLFACIAMQAMVDGRSFYISLGRYSLEDINNLDPSVLGNRLPDHHYNCRISSGEVHLDLDDYEIIKYDIFDEAGKMCLYSTQEKIEFVETIYNLESGTYFIMLSSLDYLYIGYLHID